MTSTALNLKTVTKIFIFVVRGHQMTPKYVENQVYINAETFSQILHEGLGKNLPYTSAKVAQSHSL